MSIALEQAMARLYVDAASRQRFAQDPSGEAARLGLSAQESRQLASIDIEALEAQALIFERKRARTRPKRKSWAARWWATWR